MIECLLCKEPIAPPKRKFCCKAHKDRYNHKYVYNNKWAIEYRGKTPENFLAQLIHHKGRHLKISKEDLQNLYVKQNGYCALSGELMTFVTGSGSVPTNISIDRIDSSLDYSQSNIQLVCRHVNTMKMALSKEELVEWCKKVINHNEVK